MTRIVPKLITKARKLGHKPSSLGHSSPEVISATLGTLIFRMSSVMAMAMTPSLKGSTRPVSFSSSRSDASIVALILILLKYRSHCKPLMGDEPERPVLLVPTMSQDACDHTRIHHAKPVDAQSRFSLFPGSARPHRFGAGRT